MLRLKASEITLAPADVDETLSRMQRRQAANQHTTLPVSYHGPRLPRRHPPLLGPRMRRGPERSRDAAIAVLGNIPILRPHQVALESPHDADDTGASPHSAELADDEEPDLNAASGASLAGAQTPNAASPSRRMPAPASNTELPFRPVPSARSEATEPTSSGSVSEHLPSSPPKEFLRPPRFGQVRTNSSEDGNEGLPQLRMHAATDGQVDDLDTCETTPKNNARSMGLCDSSKRSPLQHMLAVNSPRQRGGSGDPVPEDQELFSRTGMLQKPLQNPPVAAILTITSTRDEPPEHAESQSSQSDEDSPMRHLQGYFDQRQHIYTFWEHLPQTEPRPRSRRLPRDRTLSSSSDPTSRMQGLRLGPSPPTTAGDFWASPAPEPPPRTSHGAYGTTSSSGTRYWSPLGSDLMGRLQADGHTAQSFGSEASISSSAYSFYELPESRNSSASQSQNPLLANAQYDGAALSRPVSGARGSYQHLRLHHDGRQRADFAQPPSSRVFNQPSEARSGTGHSVSPLPAHPYGRVSSAQQPSRLSTSLMAPSDLIGGNQDATTAFQRGLVTSPLDRVQDRATSYLDRISAGLRPPSLPAPETGVSASHHQVADHRATQGRWPSHERQAPTQFWLPPDPRLQINGLQSRRNGTAGARAGQRSSENMPVGASSQEETAHQLGQGHSQRQTFRPRQNPPSNGANMRAGDFSTSLMSTRFSMPHPAISRDVTNQPCLQSHHSLLLPDTGHSSSDVLRPSPVSARSPQIIPPGPRISPRYASREHVEPPIRLPTRQPDRRFLSPTPTTYGVEHGSMPGPLPFNRPASRGPPSTSTTFDMASGTLSRGYGTSRPPVLRRSIPRQQINQENSDDVVRAAALAERAQVGMRYDGAEEGEGRGEVMNETPPRIGRFERHLG